MSIPTMNDDLNILQNLAIPAFEADVDVIQKLDDEPNDVGGLSAAELKAKFDEAGNRIKTYLNETLVPSISETVAEAEKRAEAEAARVLAEEQRATAEQERVSSEAEREQAEAERRAGEAERAAAESARKTAEDARVLAEQKREDTDSGIVAQATSAAEAAENAANKASSAAIHQPIVGDNQNWWTWNIAAGTYVDTGIYAAGHSPYIGNNGDWWIGAEDTGVAATGPQGPQGIAGPAGPQGEPGVQGPAGLAGSDGQDGVGIQSLEQTTTSTEDGGTNVVTVTKTDGTTSTFYVRNGSRGSTGPAGSDGQDGVDGKSAYQYAVEGGYTGTEEAFAANLAKEIPEALPNPNALTFTGAVSGSYDGSAPLNVAIPSGGGGLTVTNTAAVGQTVKITAVDENGQPTEWEAVDMAEQVQPDWNQNDSTAADYVRNRPFYLKNPVEKAIFDYSFSYAATGFMCESFDGHSIGLVDGEEYTVTISDFKFRVTAYSYEDGTIYIGNGDAALNGNTEFDGDVPFGCVDMKNEGYVFVLSEPWLISSGIISSPDDIVITKIIGSVKEPVKIDEHFLPVAKETERGIVSKSDIKNVVTDSGGFEISVGNTTYKALTDYLSKYCLPKIRVVFGDISSSAMVFLVESWETQAGTDYKISIKGNAITETNINKLYLSFPIDENTGEPAEYALLSSVDYEAPTAILLKANTKTFKITVNDDGTIIATEV